jgi:signal transduction histidine kinase
VRDHGVGLSPGENLKIWDRFYRSPHVRDRVAGSGLGLWIARALVAACGGRTDAVSAGVGYGSIFSLLIPAQHPDLEVLDD